MSSASSGGLENFASSLNDNGKEDYYHGGTITTTTTSTVEPWTISVKTVGGGFDDCDTGAGGRRGGGDPTSNTSAAGTPKTSTGNSTSFAGGGERLYTVTVCPEDGLESLHEVIEKETGVKPSQQRLIYRGRLIELDNSDNETSSSGPGPGSGSGSASSLSQREAQDSDETNGGSSNTNDDDAGTNSEEVGDQQQRRQQPNSKTDTKATTKTIRIKDIKGLSSGQTIHLVKKRVLSDGSNENENGRTSSQSSPSSVTSSGGSSRPHPLFSSNSRPTPLGDSLGEGGSGGGGGGGALLAALLGIGSIVEESSSPGIATTNGEPPARLVAANNNSDAGGTRTRRTAAATPSSTAASTMGGMSTPTAAAGGGGGSSLFGRTSHRRPHYRYSVDDLRAPNPGSMESVRQGMMTLHTLLPHSHLHREDGTSPLQANREWFRGQWCDVRDTVNQWLEATVVEILLPHEVLPEASSFPRYDVRRPPRIDTDPAIHADDLEGRRRLLIEGCDPGDPDELDGELVGFRPRRTNHGVQLLLVHYNGWPHRWDEWIRSDSERIRPFRTRTRHPTQSSHVAPTPQSVFTEAPTTNIISGDDEDDREALLPELYRVMTQVTNLLGEMVDQQQVGDGTDQRHRRVEENLPWLVSSNDHVAVGPTLLDQDDDDELMDLPGYNVVEPCDETDEDDVAVDRNALDISAVSATSESLPRSSDSRPMYTQRGMRNLATMLDRLGRTLTDAAPHVAAVAASIPDTAISSSSPQGGSGLSDAANTAAEQDHSSTPLGGILSLWSSSRERRRQSGAAIGGSLEGPQEAARIDPDHVDYASGLVNTTRGEVRSGPRNRSSNDDLATLLGSYLAAMSLNSLVNGDSDGGNLGALLRGSTGPNGGNAAGRGEGGELAIHIQAVFTSPGNPGGTGVAGGGAAVGGGGGAPATAAPVGGTRGLFSSVRSGRSSLLRSRSNQLPADSAVNNDDDESLFSDLYSENPAPIDPNTDNGLTPSSSSRSSEGNRPSFGGAPISNSTEASAQNSLSHRRSSRQSGRRASDRRGSGLFRVFRRRSRNEDS